MKTSEYYEALCILYRALHLLREPKRWRGSPTAIKDEIKGELPYTLWAAVQRAARDEAEERDLPSFSNEKVRDLVFFSLYAAYKEATPEPRDYDYDDLGNEEFICDWNDHKGRSYGEVIDLVWDAVRLLENWKGLDASKSWGLEAL